MSRTLRDSLSLKAQTASQFFALSEVCAKGLLSTDWWQIGQHTATVVGITAGMQDILGYIFEFLQPRLSVLVEDWWTYRVQHNEDEPRVLP